ncbi:hypothetical protein FHY56_09920 [Brucella gallinifaecis]|uniref:Uncharacterized protein n=1 Tax=Brucella gallinifaecis TaxID=215590 RepID=A0A502BQX6_9HYPH|nr:hypothetical protein FHY56_09920 [Brucella gallinifaecis]
MTTSVKATPASTFVILRSEPTSPTDIILFSLATEPDPNATEPIPLARALVPKACALIAPSSTVAP